MHPTPGSAAGELTLTCQKLYDILTSWCVQGHPTLPEVHFLTRLTTNKRGATPSLVLPLSHHGSGVRRHHPWHRPQGVPPRGPPVRRRHEGETRSGMVVVVWFF